MCECEYESVCERECFCKYEALEACMNQVNGLLSFLHVNGSSLFEYKELYVTEASRF